MNNFVYYRLNTSMFESDQPMGETGFTDSLNSHAYLIAHSLIQKNPSLAATVHVKQAPSLADTLRAGLVGIYFNKRNNCTTAVWTTKLNDYLNYWPNEGKIVCVAKLIDGDVCDPQIGMDMALAKLIFSKKIYNMYCKSSSSFTRNLIQIAIGEDYYAELVNKFFDMNNLGDYNG